MDAAVAIFLLLFGTLAIFGQWWLLVRIATRRRTGRSADANGSPSSTTPVYRPPVAPPAQLTASQNAYINNHGVTNRNAMRNRHGNQY